ncbi:MAG: hypothetical protein HZB29_02285 [Nitrospinae bacterium]|nr:hypothetical protein [Nitrospinota bacterium]
MSQEAVERLLGRILTDDDFRLAFRKSMKTTCHENGLVFTTEEWRMLSSLDVDKLESASGVIDKAIKRSARPKVTVSLELPMLMDGRAGEGITG